MSYYFFEPSNRRQIEKSATPTLAVKLSCLKENLTTDYISQNEIYDNELIKNEMDIAINIQKDLNEISLNTLLFPLDRGYFSEASTTLKITDDKIIILHNLQRALLISPLAPGQAIDKEFSKIHTAEQWTAFRMAVIRLVRDVKMLNDAGWSHLDIKPANINYDVTTGTIRLYDFGLAQKDIYTNADICNKYEYSEQYPLWPPELYVYFFKRYMDMLLTKHSLKPGSDLATKNQNNYFTTQIIPLWNKNRIKSEHIDIDWFNKDIFDINKLDTYAIGITLRNIFNRFVQSRATFNYEGYIDLFKKASAFDPDERFTIQGLLTALKSFETHSGGTMYKSLSIQSKSSKCPKALKPCGPQPSNERIKDAKGRNRVVYIGPRGGRYIRNDGKFIRVH